MIGEASRTRARRQAQERIQGATESRTSQCEEGEQEVDWKGKRAGRPRSQSLGFTEEEKGGMGVDVESVRGDWSGPPFQNKGHSDQLIHI